MAGASRLTFRKTKSQDSDINILLLGETGVGKSTFINSFVNYLQHNSLNNARRSQLISLIPSRFTVPDENFEDRIIEFGFDENEDIEIGNSSTQGARGYVFCYDNHNIRLIDTPGIGDARGIDQDCINFENVLSYINQFKHLHAICFLLKPNVSVINAYFKFCIMHLLSRLEKSAANNIVFLFTNCRSTFYRPGDTLPVLKRILQEIQDSPPHVKIPCDQRNMFCVDNEAFKFLVALKQNVPFGEYEMKEFSNSWERSYQTCKQFISYVCGGGKDGSIVPHPVQNTISVNEARRNIINLSKPLADICDVIQDNITILKRHEESIQQYNLSKSELISKLYIPAIELEQTTLAEPVTVCTNTKCSEIYTVEGMNKYHYKQRCHNPCYLTNVPKEIIGTPELINCAAMCGQTCTKCGCIFTAHMHIYYETKIVHTRKEDGSIKRNIKTKEDAIAAKDNIVRELKNVSGEYEFEKKEISKYMAKFAHFLKVNSISVYNDAYIDYLDYLIKREEMLGFRKDPDRIDHYMSLKKHYELEKKILDDTMVSLNKTNKNATVVSPTEVLKLVEKLYQLKHTGSKIKKLHTIQQKSVESSIKNTEYQHSTVMSSTENESSSSENESDTAIGDFDILESLLKEDSLEAMRIKLKKMKLAGSVEEVDDKKQKIFNYLIKLSDKCGSDEGRNNSGWKGRGKQRDRSQNNPRSNSGNRYARQNQQARNNQDRQARNNQNQQARNNQNQQARNNQNQQTWNNQNQLNPNKPPLLTTPPQFMQSPQLFLQIPPQSMPPHQQFQNFMQPPYLPHQNLNYNRMSSGFNQANPQFQNAPNNIRPLLSLNLTAPLQKQSNETNNTTRLNYNKGNGNYNKPAGSNNQQGNGRSKNENKFKKPNVRSKKQNRTQEESSESEEDSKSEYSNSFDMMKKLLEEKIKSKSGGSDAGSVFMYYQKKK